MKSTSACVTPAVLRLLAAAVFGVASGAGCLFDTDVAGDATVRCGSSADCGAGQVCVRGRGLCAATSQACLVLDDDGASFAPAGAPCDGGICIDGACVPPRCGDRIRSGAEECDDGNDDDGDSCKNDCAENVCGDGIRDPATEECDDGNDVQDDGCLTGCVRNVCGDGIRDPAAEECDDGNDVQGDGCLVGCVLDVCGNGIRDPSVEECDDANDDDGDACKGDCTLNVCGDGVVFVDAEACDDGNVEDGDGCRGDCSKVERCGDGLLDDGEACDDGNANDLDRCIGCRSTRWSPVVRAGSGEGDGDPLATTLDATAMAIDGDGNLLIATLADLRLYRLDAAAGKLTPWAGTGTLADIAASSEVPATEIAMTGVVGLSVDGLGNVLVSDFDDAVIRRIDARTRTVQTIAGTGEQGFGGDGLPATLATLSEPEMAIADGSGNVFIADTDNHRIRRIDASTGVITTVAGTGIAAFSGDGGDPLLAALDSPRDLDFDVAGNLYVLDRNNGRIRRLEPDPDDRGRFARITTVAGDGTLYDPDDVGLLRGIGDAGLQSMSVSPDGSRIYVVTYDMPAVLLVDVAAGTVELFAGSIGERGARFDVPALQARFTKPEDVHVQGEHRVYVTDPFAGLLHVIERDDATSPWIVRTFAGRAPDVLRDQVFEFAPALMQQLGTGYAVSRRTGCDAFVEPLYVYGALSDTHRVLERRCSGAIRVVAGTGVAGFFGDGGPASLARLSTPRGVLATTTGLVFVADQGNHRVRRVDVDQTITTVAGTGEPRFSGDGGPAQQAALSGPTDVDMDDEDRLFIVDSGNNRIRRVTLSTGVIQTLAGTGDATPGSDGIAPTTLALAQPYGARFLPASSLVAGATGGLLVFTERASHRVRVWMDVQIPGVPASLLTPRIFTIAGTGAPGYRDAEDGKTALFFHPRSLSLFAGPGCSGGPGDASACLLVLDGYDRVRLLRLTATGALAEPVAASVTTLRGGDGPADDGTTATATLRGPSSFAFLDDARIALVERVTGRLRLIDLVADRVQTIAGLPDGDDPGAGEVAVDVARPLLDPTSVVYDDRATPGRLYVSERAGHTIREFILVDPDDPTTWTTRTLVGRSGALGHRDGPLATARLAGPDGLAIDPSTSTLYVAERGNHTIRRVDLVQGTVATIAGRPGQLGSFGDGVPAASALLHRPSGLAFLPPSPAAGRGATLYVADTGNHRVRRIDDVDGTAPTITTVLGDGAAASSGEGRPARFFPVNAPTSVDVDAAGNVYATSRDAVRAVLSGDAGRAGGDDDVTSIYGAPPRATFPEPITTCLQHVRVAPAANAAFAIDSCQGLLIELVRSTTP